jgi:hypothetical protein
VPLFLRHRPARNPSGNISVCAGKVPKNAGDGPFLGVSRVRKLV